jgi:hypothetical protein
MPESGRDPFMIQRQEVEPSASEFRSPQVCDLRVAPLTGAAGLKEEPSASLGLIYPSFE